MRTYIATQGRATYTHGLMCCLSWSAKQIELNPDPIKIFKARAGEAYATVIAEVTSDSIRFITNGRIVATKALRDG